MRHIEYLKLFSYLLCPIALYIYFISLTKLSHIYRN